jgi:hypothetical protein
MADELDARLTRHRDRMMHMISASASEPQGASTPDDNSVMNARNEILALPLDPTTPKTTALLADQLKAELQEIDSSRYDTTTGLLDEDVWSLQQALVPPESPPSTSEPHTPLNPSHCVKFESPHQLVEDNHHSPGREDDISDIQHRLELIEAQEKLLALEKEKDQQKLQKSKASKLLDSSAALLSHELDRVSLLDWECSAEVAYHILLAVDQVADRVVEEWVDTAITDFGLAIADALHDQQQRIATPTRPSGPTQSSPLRVHLTLSTLAAGSSTSQAALELEDNDGANQQFSRSHTDTTTGQHAVKPLREWTEREVEAKRRADLRALSAMRELQRRKKAEREKRLAEETAERQRRDKLKAMQQRVRSAASRQKESRSNSAQPPLSGDQALEKMSIKQERKADREKEAQTERERPSQPLPRAFSSSQRKPGTGKVPRSHRQVSHPSGNAETEALRQEGWALLRRVYSPEDEATSDAVAEEMKVEVERSQLTSGALPVTPAGTSDLEGSLSPVSRPPMASIHLGSILQEMEISPSAESAPEAQPLGLETSPVMSPRESQRLSTPSISSPPPTSGSVDMIPKTYHSIVDETELPMDVEEQVTSQPDGEVEPAVMIEPIPYGGHVFLHTKDGKGNLKRSWLAIDAAGYCRWGDSEKKAHKKPQNRRIESVWDCAADIIVEYRNKKGKWNEDVASRSLTLQVEGPTILHVLAEDAASFRTWIDVFISHL